VNPRCLADLKDASYNPREISDTAAFGLAASLSEFGDISGIVFNTKTGNLVCGHQRVSELRKAHGDLKIKAGRIETPDGHVFVVRLVKWTEEMERVANVAANNPHIAGSFTDGISELLADIRDDDNELFASLGLDTLLDDFPPLNVGEGLTDLDQVPDAPEEPVSKRGDLWICGNHRVLCGDSTNADDVARLMGGEKADIAVTDPPYGVSYADKNKFLNAADKGNCIQSEIINDHLSEEDVQELWFAVFQIIRDNLAAINSYYVFGPQIQGMMMMMMMMMQKAGLPYRHVIIWVKNNHVLGRCDYHYKHEPLFFGWTTKHKFYGKGKMNTSVWEFARPHQSKLHPTMKPVDLLCECLLNSSLPNQIVLDLFLGSGSTLIAAEKLGRRCFGVEISEAYCDVIINRWQEFTGKEARLDNGS
jgi:DNA modification methylase